MDQKLHNEKCETCCSVKATKTSVPKQSENKASKAGERVFTDVAGPLNPSSVDGFRYFVTYIDDYSSHACVKFMGHKNQALQNFQEVTLLKMVLFAYYGLTMAPSIRTKFSITFVPTTKSSKYSVFLDDLRNRIMSQNDTT